MLNPALSQNLVKFTDVRRYASLVCVISEAKATLTDEVIDLHERILGSLFIKAKRTQAERLQQTGRLIQSKLKQYVTIGRSLGRNRRRPSLAGIYQQRGRDALPVT